MLFLTIAKKIHPSAWQLSQLQALLAAGPPDRMANPKKILLVDVMSE